MELEQEVGEEIKLACREWLATTAYVTLLFTILDPRYIRFYATKTEKSNVFRVYSCYDCDM